MSPNLMRDGHYFAGVSGLGDGIGGEDDLTVVTGLIKKLMVIF